MIDRMIDSRGLDSFDLRFIGLIVVILSVGVVSIYSVTHSQDTAFPFYLKQLVWILLGTVAFLVMYLSDYHKIARLAYPTYAVILILLAVVLVMGKSSRGAQRWIPIGPFAFQPSEFAKLVLVLVLANCTPGCLGWGGCSGWFCRASLCCRDCSSSSNSRIWAAG